MTLSITLDKLNQMKLRHMAESLERRLSKKDQEGLSPQEFVALLVEDEYLRRQHSKLERLHKNAAFKIRATLEEVDYDAARGLKKQELLEFTQRRWLDNFQNIYLSGPTGVGKTFLACAIGNEACRMGHSAYYSRTSKLWLRLAAMRGTGDFLKFREGLAKVRVLILDDIGLSPLTQEQSEDMMELIDDRYLSGSTIVTSQLPKDKIYQAFPEPTLADAICDRLLHNSHTLTLKGESRRKKPVSD